MSESPEFTKNETNRKNHNNEKSDESSSDFLTVKEVLEVLPWMTVEQARYNAHHIDPNFIKNPGRNGHYRFHRAAVIAYRIKKDGGGQ